jgi:DNA-binding transcriptional ArsR family regulator
MPHAQQILQALADPTRRTIFERLTKSESAVNDLHARFDISQPAISQHLKRLKTAGLVTARRDGKHLFYRAHPAGLRPLVDWIEHYQIFWLDRLGRLKKLLAAMEKKEK